MTYTTGSFTVDELGFIQLASRGLDLNGTWVGFEQARAIHNV